MRRQPDYYTVPLSIGTPPQTVNVALEMRGPTLFVHGVRCHHDACREEPGYDPAASSSSIVLENSTMPEGYMLGLGAELDMLARDTVRLGNHAANHVIGESSHNDS